MLGAIVELLLSWLLLWWVEKQNLSVLGFSLTKKHLFQLAAGFLAAIIACSIYHLGSVMAAHNQWLLKDPLDTKAILNAIWFVIKSVLFEELLFRGALLYIAIKKMGTIKACLLSAACFGVYHWFTYQAFSNPFWMAMIFFTTGITGYAFAVAYAKTRSLYLPIGLHLGWNLFNMVVFKGGPMGALIFEKANKNSPQGLVSLCLFAFQVFIFPVLVLGYFRMTEQRKKRFQKEIGPAPRQDG